ncbi:uncharacterized protein LOC106012140, partial [Aplysia californica]|uniref:Uncharacterized protein LOC106012140 n=1 Tax=Aplysia californica TaxID=6500 RepID=A0ABM1A2K5_APLCA
NQCAPKIGYDGQCRFVYENPCAGQLTCDVTSRCKCFSGQYHSGNNLCAPRLAHGAGCANLEDPCQSGLSCVLNYNNFAPKCLCDPIGSSYWNGLSCQSVDWFTASERVSTRGPNLINFIWTVTPEGFVNNYQVVTQSSLQSCLQVQDSKSEPGSSIGVSFTGLRAGVKYLSTLTLVLTATTDYPERSKVVNLPEAWTKPAQPGAVIPGSSTLSVPRTVLKFGPSDGCVAGYSVAVTRQGFAPRSKSVTNDTAVFENLVADTVYTYFITAYNGDNEPGGPRIGSFTTEVAGPGHVSVLSHLSVIATGVVVSWRRPSEPNGNLKGYKVWVTTGGQCVKQFHVQCLDCDVSVCKSPLPSSPVSQYDSTDL